MKRMHIDHKTSKITLRKTDLGRGQKHRTHTKVSSRPKEDKAVHVSQKHNLEHFNDHPIVHEKAEQVQGRRLVDCSDSIYSSKAPVMMQDTSIQHSDRSDLPIENDQTHLTMYTTSSDALPTSTTTPSSASTITRISDQSNTDPDQVIKANIKAPEATLAHSEAHSRALAAGLLSALLFMVLIGLTVIIFFLRRRRRSRRQGLREVLDKVTTPPPPRPDRAEFESNIFDEDHDRYSHSLRSSVNDRAPTIDIPVVPTLDLSRLHDRDVDLEANDRHSAELSRQKIVGQRVRSDMSFSWRFPKLSVPPAAARALSSGHYVKKRSTIASPASLTSISCDKDSPSLSLSSAAELAFGRCVPVPDMSMTMSNSSKSAAPSSSCIDPVIDPTTSSFNAQPPSQQNRTRWWSSSLHGFSRSGTVNDKTNASNARSTSTPTISTLSCLSWHTRPAITPNPVVLAAHDPLLQDVVAHVLSLVAGNEPTASAQQSSARDESASEVYNHSRQQQQHHLISSGQRRVSQPPKMLETCRESSNEKLDDASGDSVQIDAMKIDLDSELRYSSLDAGPSTPAKTERSLSEAYSAHSIVLHEDSSSGSIDDVDCLTTTTTTRKQQERRSSRKLDSNRKSLTPKILLTSTQEDGSHERQLSMTSIESTTSGSLSSGLRSLESDSDSVDSMEFAYAAHSMLPKSISRCANDDIANAIGQAFMAHMLTERRIAKQRSVESMRRVSRHVRDSDSTIDSLATYQNHRQDVLAKSESFEGAFNDAFSEAASARLSSSSSSISSESLTEDIGEISTDDDKSVVTARPGSVSQSESEIAACLLDDDFPTIPTWKSISTQKSYATTETATMDWRSASSMSIATIRQ